MLAPSLYDNVISCVPDIEIILGNQDLDMNDNVISCVPDIENILGNQDLDMNVSLSCGLARQCLI